ncbi:hypothetical protein C0J52_12343 [Blattella germanica]|nr:hypothetical protein C0J52_12343 [Blattella germanica]
MVTPSLKLHLQDISVRIIVMQIYTNKGFVTRDHRVPLRLKHSSHNLHHDWSQLLQVSLEWVDIPHTKDVQKYRNIRTNGVLERNAAAPLHMHVLHVC